MQGQSEAGEKGSTLSTFDNTKTPETDGRWRGEGKEKGSSGWLVALPIESHDFALHKSAFRDGICLRYGWQPPLLPTTCACGTSFTIDHALNCPTGGFPIIRHNEVQDITADLMSEVSHDVCVCVEPVLQTLTGEQLSHATANREESARLDVRACGFWRLQQQSAFLCKGVQPMRTIII